MENTIPFRQDIRNALDVLRRGGVILYPTDTVWGLGCDATNPEAVERIFRIKNRRDGKSMLSLVGSLAQLERTVKTVPEVAYQLLEAAVDPVTVIYDSPVGLAPALLADDGSAGIRVTDEQFSRELCRAFRRPIVSTSANKSGKKAPATYAEIEEEIRQAADYVVSYRRDDMTPSRPSAIIKLTDSGIVKVIR